MFKKAFFILFCIWLSSYCLADEQSPTLKTEDISTLAAINQGDRILILVPHPDDEAIACAGIIQEALKAKARLQVVYLTNGDHNQIAFIVYEKRLTLKKNEFIHMGQVRRQEAIKAMESLGLKEDNLTFLGYPDFGTFAIFSRYWRTQKPFRSLLTRISAVPYKENMSFQQPYIGESILADLKKVLLRYRPNKIFVSHPADTNVDHKALYLFLQIALRDLNKELPSPKVYPYLVHCVGWPSPRHYHPELTLKPPRNFLNSQIKWLEFKLAPKQLEKKHQAILCYKSQTESSAFYLLSFARKNELFSDYPEIKLTRQAPLKQHPVSFFGFSEMFADSDIGALGGLDNLIGDKGRVSYALVDGSILIRVENTRKLNRRFGFLLYLFGYNGKTPFSSMPKIRIITRYNKFKVFDGKKMIKPQDISLELNSTVLILKVPLKVLGNPDFILTSIKVYGGVLPVDAIGFRKIVIK